MPIDVTIALIDGTIRSATPLLLAGLGSLIYERSGVVNLAPEAFMLVGAISSVIANVHTGSAGYALAAAVIATTAVAVVHGVLCVVTRINQVALGLCFVIVFGGVSAVIGRNYLGRPVSADLTISLPLLSDIPVIGRLFQRDIVSIATPVLALSAWYILYRLRLGIRLRAVGENATFAIAIGIPVRRVRLCAAATCGALSGLAGAYLALIVASQWQQDLVAGRGWIAIVAVVLAQWHPLALLAIGYGFGLLLAMPLYLQAIGVAISAYLVQLLLYGVCIVALSLYALARDRHIQNAPGDLGRPLL